MKQRFTKLLMGAAFVAGGVSSAYADDYVPTIYAGSTSDITAAGKTVGLVKFQPNADNSAITPELIKAPVPASGTTHTTPSLFGYLDTFNSNTYNNWQPWCLMSGVLTNEGKWVGYYVVASSTSTYATYYKEYDVSDEDPANWKAVTGTSIEKASVYKMATSALTADGWFAYDATYDPVSGKVYAAYGISGTSTTSTGTYFGTAGTGSTVIGEVDYKGYTAAQTRENKIRVKVGSTYLTALAANSKGHLYGVGDEGYLIRINNLTTQEANEDNGAVTVVKISDADKKALKESTSIGSATFDPNTDKLYYIARSGGNTAKNTSSVTASLVEITIDEENNTATVKEVGTLPSGHLYTGLFIKELPKAAGTPEAVTDLGVTAETGNSVAVSFTLPTADTDGNSLTGDVNYTIKVNGTEQATGSGAAGSKVSKTLTVDGDGNVTVVVSVKAGDNESAEKSAAVYVGQDNPQAATGVTLAIDADRKVTLSWTAPATGAGQGVNKGDVAAVTFDVVRRLGTAETTVATGLTATSFSETLDEPAEDVSVTYIVTAKNGTHVSSGASSNAVELAAPKTVPYTEDFTFGKNTNSPVYANKLPGFTEINCNGDNEYWKADFSSSWLGVDYYASYRNESIDAGIDADEWLLTPEIKLTAGQKYALTFTHWSLNGDFTDEDGNSTGAYPYDESVKFSVHLGQGLDPTADGQYQVLKPEFAFDNTEHTTTVRFKAPATGNFRIAFHCADTKVEAKEENGKEVSVQQTDVDDKPLWYTDESMTETTTEDMGDDLKVMTTEWQGNGTYTTVNRSSAGVAIDDLLLTEIDEWNDLAISLTDQEYSDKEGFSVSVVVTNNGTATANVKYAIYNGDELVQEVTTNAFGRVVTLAAGKTGTYAFKFKTTEEGTYNVSAKLIEADDDATNDVSEVLAINYTKPEEVVKVEIGKAGWASFVDWSHSVEVPEGVTAYAVTEFTAAGAKLEAISQIPVETPVLLNGPVGEVKLPYLEYGITDGDVWDVLEDEDENSLNLLEAGDGEDTVGDGSTIWGLAEVDGVVGFRRVATGSVIPEGKVYVEADLGSSARSFIPLTGDATAIAGLKAALQGEAPVYNLSGQRVGRGFKGLVVSGGKKVVVK